MNVAEIARVRIVHQPQECASNCDIPDCHFCHQESWSIWRGDKYESGPYETENAALLTALEQSQAALAEAQKQRDSLIVDVSQWARKAGEAQGKLEASETAGIVKSWKDKCDALRARLEVAKEAMKPFAQEAECWSDRAPDDLSVSVHSIDAEHFGTPSLFTVGDLRRARAAVAEMERDAAVKNRNIDA